MLGNVEKKQIAAVLLSNSTILRRIEDMAADIRDQVCCIWLIFNLGSQLSCNKNKTKKQIGCRK